MKDLLETAWRRSLARTMVPRGAEQKVLELPEGLGEDLGIDLEEAETELDFLDFLREPGPEKAVADLLLLEDFAGAWRVPERRTGQAEEDEGRTAKKKKKKPKVAAKTGGRSSSPKLPSPQKKKATKRKTSGARSSGKTRPKRKRVRKPVVKKRRPVVRAASCVPSDLARRLSKTSRAPLKSSGRALSSSKARSVVTEKVVEGSETNSRQTEGVKASSSVLDAQGATPTEDQVLYSRELPPVSEGADAAKTLASFNTDHKASPPRVIIVKPQSDRDEWRLIPEFPGIEAARDGRLRMYYDRCDPSSFFSKPIDADIRDNGHQSYPVILHYDPAKDRYRPIPVSKLVARAFRPETGFVDWNRWRAKFRDGNPRNCRADNLSIRVRAPYEDLLQPEVEIDDSLRGLFPLVRDLAWMTDKTLLKKLPMNISQFELHLIFVHLGITEEDRERLRFERSHVRLPPRS